MIKLDKMVLKGVKWLCKDKIRSNGHERSQLCTKGQKLGQMVLKGVNWVHNVKNLGHMVWKGVNWVHNDKNQVKWF